METFTDKAKRLDRIRRALKRKYGDVERRPVTHPVEHAVRTVLQEEATREEVDAAMDRIRDHFIDFNDLRVSRPREIREVLGDDFPRASSKARVIPRLLDQVFKRHNSMVWDFLEGMGKVECREFFEALEEVRPYVAATMARDCTDAHAFPVDRDVGRVLGRLGLVDLGSESEADMQAFMERAVKSTQAWELHALLRRLAEEVCLVDEPRCSKCPLKTMCPTVERRAEERKRKRTKKAAAKKKKKKAARPSKKAAGRKTAAKASKTKKRKKAASRSKSAKGKGGSRAKRKKKTARRKTKR
jgi:endonuclease-3